MRGRFDHLAAFPHGVRRRFLDVDVFAGLERPDRRQRVPVIRGGNHDRIHVLVVEDAPEVLDEAGLEGRDVGQPLVVDALGGGSRRCRTGS